MKYLIIWHDSRYGMGNTANEAIEDAIGPRETADFLVQSEPRGYNWTAYTQRTAKPKANTQRLAPVTNISVIYETATINSKDGKTQICQVFRAENTSTIFYLRDRFAARA